MVTCTRTTSSTPASCRAIPRTSSVQVVYDELAILDEYDGVDITRITRELKPKNPLGLNLMRITVDGIPIDDPKRSSADIQRCTDVAFANVDIQFGYDNLRSCAATQRRRTAERARPIVREKQEEPARSYGGSYEVPDRRSCDARCDFRMYTNYSSFIESAEIRDTSRPGRSPEAEPLDVIADRSRKRRARWTPNGVGNLTGFVQTS